MSNSSHRHNDNKGNSIIANVFWKFSERVSAQLISLVVSVVLARLLLPEDYGIISMVMVFITFADVLIASGLPTALIQKRNADELDFSSVFCANVVIAIVLYIVLFIGAPNIAEFFNMPILAIVLKVLGIRVIVAAISSVQQAYVSRNMMFKKFFWSTLFSTVFSGIVGLVMAFAGFGVWALVSQQLVSSIVSTIVLFFIVPWRPKALFSWDRLKGLLKYGWKILFEGLAETFTTQVRNLIIGRVYTSSDLGYYTKAQQFPNLLITNVVTSISAVLFPAMSNIQDDIDSVKQLLRKAARLSSYVMFPLMFGLALVAEPFVIVVLTDKWIECVPYIQIFCLTQGATVGMIVRHEALKSIGRSDVYMYEHIVYRIIVLLILIAVYRISVMAIALSLIAGSIIMSFTVGITSRVYNNYGFKEQFIDVFPIICACIVMSVPVYLVSLLPFNSLICLLVQIIVGIVVYVIISHLFKFEGYIYILSLIKKVLNRGKVNA